MNNLEKEFILLLANPKFSNDEIKKLKNKLRSRKNEVYFEKAQNIKNILSHKENTANKDDFNDPNLTNYELKILNEVNDLLRKEVKLTVKDAVEGLANRLQITPLSYKYSFKNQVLHFIRESQGSAVINAALKLQHEILNKSDDAHWPFREQK